MTQEARVEAPETVDWRAALEACRKQFGFIAALATSEKCRTNDGKGWRPTRLAIGEECYEAVQFCERALAAADAVEWQDISTAPRERIDGVLQYVQLIGRYPTNNEWTDIAGQCWWAPPVTWDGEGNWERWWHSFPPTHWRPLPSPPKEPR